MKNITEEQYSQQHLRQKSGQMDLRMNYYPQDKENFNVNIMQHPQASYG